LPLAFLQSILSRLQVCLLWLQYWPRGLTWHFVSKHVEDILLASKDEIVEAMRFTWQRMKIVMEPPWMTA
jgi:hypothetical protein